MAGVLLSLDDRELVRAAMRWQVTILYGFAALAKLTGDYLSGHVIAVSAHGNPVAEMVGFGSWVPFAVAGLLTEAFLALGLWRFPRVAIPVGVAFHLSVVAVMADDWVHVARLACFGGLLLAFYPAFMPDRLGAGVVVGEDAGRAQDRPAPAEVLHAGEGHVGLAHSLPMIVENRISRCEISSSRSRSWPQRGL
jgi:hypothetical protein